VVVAAAAVVIAAAVTTAVVVAAASVATDTPDSIDVAPAARRPGATLRWTVTEERDGLA
jgi:hypothetical protein